MQLVLLIRWCMNANALLEIGPWRSLIVQGRFLTSISTKTPPSNGNAWRNYPLSRKSPNDFPQSGAHVVYRKTLMVSPATNLFQHWRVRGHHRIFPGIVYTMCVSKRWRNCSVIKTILKFYNYITYTECCADFFFFWKIRENVLSESCCVTDL